MRSRKTPPASVLAAASYVSATALPDDSRLEALGFPVVRKASGHANDVWVSVDWAIKRPRGAMDAELARWRRSPRGVVEFYAQHANGHAGRNLPATVLVGERVLVQERADPNPIRFAAHQNVVDSVGKLLGLSNLSSDNVGWFGRTPVFIDVEYRGPDLTVVLLLKLDTKRREAQGENPFWQEWGAIYLERMVRNIRRHLPANTRIVVMTDRPAVVPAGCDTAGLQGDQPGWWAKLNMFRRDVTCGRCLYLDLDNVLAAPIPELLTLRPNPLIMMDDRQMPGLPNASTMLFFAEQVRYLWDEYAKDPPRMHRQFHETRWPHASDQGYTTALVRERTGQYPPYFQDLLGDGYALNSRVELEAGAPWNTTRLVFGCWTPKPHESLHQFYSLHWHA